jgi:hypothetical protein
MLIPYPHAVQRNCEVPRWGFVRTPHLHLRTDKASAFARAVFALECLPTLAVCRVAFARARDMRGEARLAIDDLAIDETARPLIHAGALPSVSNPLPAALPRPRRTPPWRPGGDRLAVRSDASGI